jgi:hypothetical protein
LGNSSQNWWTCTNGVTNMPSSFRNISMVIEDCQNSPSINTFLSSLHYQNF